MVGSRGPTRTGKSVSPRCTGRSGRKVSVSAPSTLRTVRSAGSGKQLRSVGEQYDSGVQNGQVREVATLGGGCFWCLEAVFDELKGVTDVVSGYAGGHVPDPSYEQVCGGRTGHAEVVQVTFDPSVVSFRDILHVFFTIHDPTTRDRQGNDVGPQYRSIVLYNSPEQEAIAREVIAELTAEGLWKSPIVTQVEPLQTFYPAEDYHQEYFARNPGAGYCQFIIAPKVAKFRQKYLAQLKR